jgi:hypothetical protein
MNDAVRVKVGSWLSVAISASLHVLFVIAIGAVTSTSDIDIELTLPEEVEFGLTDAREVELESSSSQRSSASPEGPAPRSGEGLAAADAGVPLPPDAGVPPDAGAPDAGRRRRRPKPEVASATDGEDATDGADGAGGDARNTRMPAGAQIALRMDMTRIRSSRLAPDVRNFLDAIPDWQMVLRGSSLAPVDDLDRVLVASPNLQRSRMVVAGSFPRDADWARQIVDTMASARGTTATWRDESGVEVADWANEDETARVLALIGPHHFAITRPEDLPAVLAIGRVRAEESGFSSTAADALLEMPEGSALTLTVEGARTYARGAHAPERLELVVSERAGGGADVAIEARYETPEAADAAREYWTEVAEEQSRSIAVRLLGLSSALDSASLTTEGRTVRATTALTERQIRLVLSFVQGQLEAWGRERGRRRRAPEVPSSLDEAPSAPAGSPSDGEP